MQFAAIDNYWGQPVYLGGTKADGTSEINPLSYIFLDVYDRMGIYNPKIQLKISDKSTPKEFILKALDMIRQCVIFHQNKLTKSCPCIARGPPLVNIYYSYILYLIFLKILQFHFFNI